MPDVTREVTCEMSEPPQIGPLSAMVRDLLATPGISTRILAERTFDESINDQVLKKDFWSKMAKDVLPKVPNATQLEWMAVAMRRPSHVIKEAAAAQYFDYAPLHLSGYDDDMRRIIIQAGAMNAGERRRLRVQLEATAEDGSAN